jgi:hypothetical protein
MKSLLRSALLALIPALALMALGSAASASTLNQNVSWTIDRAGTTTKYRVVAYGDSIYAGYNGSISNAAKFAAPTVDAEYLSALWNADIESVRRAKSGAVASDVYNNKIVGRALVHAGRQHARGHVRDVRQRRPAGAQRTSRARSGHLQLQRAGRHAEASCKTYVAAAMDYINANAYAGVKLKVISNLFYPGYAADNVQSSCRDARHRRHRQPAGQVPAGPGAHQLLDVRVRAAQKGFQCTDSFADYMGADYDRNGDGLVDSEALALHGRAKAKSNYVTRITSTLRSTIRDANTHLVSATSSYDYIQSDDVHPTYSGRHRHCRAVRGQHRQGGLRATATITGRQEPDLEPIWPRAHGLGGCPPPTPRHPDAAGT